MTSDATTGTGMEAPPVRKRRRRTEAPRSVLHSGMNVDRYFIMHLQGAVFPVTAGLLLYGWRALGVMVVVLAMVGVGTMLWRRIGRSGGQLRMSHAIWNGTLLAMMLPAHLLSERYMAAPGIGAIWAIVPAAALLLVIMIWLMGGMGSGRVHPVLLTYLVLMVLFGNVLVPHTVLHPTKLFVGDVTRSGIEAPSAESIKTPWIHLRNPAERSIGDALWREPPSQQLIFYTSGTRTPDRAWLPLIALLRDQMPPLEDLIIGGQPTPIGLASGVAVIIGGLFLLYRGLIDWCIPLLIVLTAFVGFLVLPVPVVLTDVSVEWRWLAMRWHGVGWQTAVTFANYEVLSGPLLFAAFFIATAPSQRPMTRRGRVVFAIVVGLCAAVFQLYASVSIGPYLAVLVGSLLTPLLDHLIRPRALV